MKKIPLIIFSLCSLLSVSACAVQEGPDKTIGTATLGAAWGAGAGAIIGDNISPRRVPEGIGIGVAFGLVEGAMIGASADITESELIRQEKELKKLKLQNQANQKELFNIQAKLDLMSISSVNASVYQVFFDTDATNLRFGASKNLEAIANALKKSPSAVKIHVDGHTDETGSASYNEELATARAENVAASLIAMGISQDQLIVESFAATRPIASNVTKEGKQLNRRVDVYIAK